MAQIHLLDKDGLSYLWIKIKALIPTNISTLINDADYQTSSDVSASINAVIDDTLTITGNAADSAAVGTILANKVDKETGKVLSSNDYTTIEKNKLAGIDENANHVAVDNSMSDISTNPVQNNIIKSYIDNLLQNKVDKVTGKGLSTNDYTTTEKNKLAGIESGATAILIDSFLSEEGQAADAKAVGDALAQKVSSVSGKGLSTNDYTTAEKDKLAGIATGANKTIVDSSMSDNSTNPVQNKIVKAYIDALEERISALETANDERKAIIWANSSS